MAPPDRDGAAGDLPLPRRAVILASASASRIAMLENAGVPFEAIPPGVDEDEIKAALKAKGADGAAIATELAARKARAVALRYPDRLVIGADQMLACEGALYDKPDGRAAARRQLLALRGRMHELISAVCVMRGSERLWQHLDTARLWMRPFSDAFADRYLARSGEEALASVGAYRLESEGVQLFERIEGDWFTILGLPLLPLLDYLRTRQVLTT